MKDFCPENLDDKNSSHAPRGRFDGKDAQRRNNPYQGNPKHEIRNSKQSLVYSNFMLVSCFELRFSDFFGFPSALSCTTLRGNPYAFLQSFLHLANRCCSRWRVPDDHCPSGSAEIFRSSFLKAKSPLGSGFAGRNAARFPHFGKRDGEADTYTRRRGEAAGGSGWLRRGDRRQARADRKYPVAPRRDRGSDPHRARAEDQ